MVVVIVVHVCAQEISALIEICQHQAVQFWAQVKPPSLYFLQPGRNYIRPPRSSATFIGMKLHTKPKTRLHA